MNLNLLFLQNSTGIKLADWDQSIVIRLLLQHTQFYTGSFSSTQPELNLSVIELPAQNILNSHCGEFIQRCSCLYNQWWLFFFPSDSHYSGSLWCCQSYLQSSVIYHRKTKEPLAGALVHALLSCHFSSRESQSFLADPLLSHKSL